MSYTIESQLNNHVINIPGTVKRSTDMIWHIMDSVFSLGASYVMLASSVNMRNWTISATLWYQNSKGVTDYIHHRMMNFDQIYCQTQPQAELVVLRLEQYAIVHALKKDY